MATEVIAHMYGPGKEGLTAPQMAVALSYANHAHKDGTGAFPGTDTVVEETRLSRRSVQNARAALVAKGVLELEREATHNAPARYCFPAMRATAARGATVTPLEQIRGAAGAPLEQERGAAPAPLEQIRGAADDVRGATGASRGADGALRGAGAAPKPSLTVKQPSEEPTTSRARDRGLTIVRALDERDADDLEQEREAEERASREWERTSYQAAANGGESAFDRWERMHGDQWRKAAAGAGLMPNRMPQAPMPSSSYADYGEAAG